MNAAQKQEPDRAEEPFSVVTGAFGFSGQHIARALLARGEKVRTLTKHPDRGSTLYGQLEVAELDFRNIPALTLAMGGASVLYNTYWVRFAHRQVNHAAAVEDIKSLIAAAEAAGVKEIRGLMADLLVSSRPPTGHTSLRPWIEAHRQDLGAAYASELGRHSSEPTGK